LPLTGSEGLSLTTSGTLGAVTCEIAAGGLEPDPPAHAVNKRVKIALKIITFFTANFISMPAALITV
jgi:hypothetical protein